MQPMRNRREHAGALLIAFSLPMLLLLGVTGVATRSGAAALLPLMLLALTAGLALSRRRLRLLAAGVGGGVAAGLALGVALRLTMRIAALMGGGREVTADGTGFLLLSSVMLGVVVGVPISGMRRLWNVPAPGVAIATALLGVVVLVAPPETRAELAERGAFWVNLPLFAASFALYGGVVVLAQRRIEGWWDGRAGRHAALPGPAADMEGTPA